MRFIRILPLVAALSCSFPLALSAAGQPASGWDPVLDGIHAHTWRGRDELAAELKKEETRIGQDLAGYIAAWEERQAAPIVYAGTEQPGEGCDPRGYCAADFLDAGGLIGKLREQREPVARFLFGKLSPEAQKTLADAGPAVSPTATRLLAGELSRIVREETLYDAERFGGIRLSFGLALVNEQNNAQNRVCANKTLLADAFPEELARNFKCVILKDEAYRRLVAAKTVQYLQTGDSKSLADGIALGENFENRLVHTDFAFWYYYPRALADVEAGNSAALKHDAYALLNSVVLWGEQPATGTATPADLDRRHYGWNLADLVLSRGIMAGRMEGLEALGPAVWLLALRSEASAAGGRQQELAQQIVDLRTYLAGPESDNFRLNYAVALREGERRLDLLVRALDAGEKGARVEQLYSEVRDYLRLACKWAGTGQGRVTAVTRYLELANMALARMKDILPPASYAALAGTADKVNAGMAASLFRALAEKEAGGWEELRFTDRKGYVTSAQRLWNALRRNSLLAADYYLARLDRDDFQSVMDNAELAERALLGYLKLFDDFTVNGHREIVPDSAYFAYAEALKKMSGLKRTVYAYNEYSGLHDQSIDYLLKGIVIYPYDDSITDYAAISRTINTGSIGMLPDMVISRIATNQVMAKCLAGNASYCDKNSRQALEWNIYKVTNRLYGRNGGSRLEEMNQLVRSWPDEPRTAGGKGAKPGNQRASLLALAESYLTLAGQLTTLSADAGERLARCSAAGTGCAESRATIDTLLAKREELAKLRDGLTAACGAYTAGGGKESAYAANLTDIVNDCYVYQADRIIAVGMQQKSYDLRTMNNHPMHKIIRSGYYAGR